MKVLVIGASGLTGQLVLKHIQDTPHEVTAFVRNPVKLADKSAHLHVIQGDARDAVAIENAVVGQDAIIATTGQNTLRKDDVQEIIMRNLVAAMSKVGVKKLVNLSAMAAGDSLEGTEFFMRRIMLPLFYRMRTMIKIGVKCIFLTVNWNTLMFDPAD